MKSLCVIHKKNTYFSVWKYNIKYCPDNQLFKIVNL